MAGDPSPWDEADPTPPSTPPPAATGSWGPPGSPWAAPRHGWPPPAPTPPSFPAGRRSRLSGPALVALSFWAVVVVVVVVAVAVGLLGSRDDEPDATGRDRSDEHRSSDDEADEPSDPNGDDQYDGDQYDGDDHDDDEPSTTVSIPGLVELPELETPVAGYPGQLPEDPCPTREEVSLATGLSAPPPSTPSELPSKLHPDVVSNQGVQVAVSTCLYPPLAKVHRALDPTGAGLAALSDPPDGTPARTEVIGGREYVVLETPAPPGTFEVTTLAFDHASHLIVVAVPTSSVQPCDGACAARLAELVVNRST